MNKKILFLNIPLLIPIIATQVSCSTNKSIDYSKEITNSFKTIITKDSAKKLMILCLIN